MSDINLDEIKRIHLINENQEFIIVPREAILKWDYQLFDRNLSYIDGIAKIVANANIEIDVESLMANYQKESYIYDYIDKVPPLDYIVNFMHTREDLAQIEIEFNNDNPNLVTYPDWGGDSEFEDNPYQKNSKVGNIITITLDNTRPEWKSSVWQG